MNTGWTGLVLQEELRLGWFGKVHVYHLETYETYDMVTCDWHKVRTLKFKNSKEAKNFINTYNTSNCTSNYTKQA